LKGKNAKLQRTANPDKDPPEERRGNSKTGEGKMGDSTVDSVISVELKKE